MPGITIRRLAGERIIRLAGSAFSDRVTQNRLDVSRGDERGGFEGQISGACLENRPRTVGKQVSQNQAICGTDAPGRHDYSGSVIESPNFKMTYG